MGIRFFFSMIGFSDDLWGRLKPYLFMPFTFFYPNAP